MRSGHYYLGLVVTCWAVVVRSGILWAALGDGIIQQFLLFGCFLFSKKHAICHYYLRLFVPCGLFGVLGERLFFILARSSGLRCSGLLWAALGCSGLLWAALGCSGLFWAALGGLRQLK